MKSFIFSAVVLYSVSSYSIECLPREYEVRGHPRIGYIRSDGTFVKPTTVNTYCKEFTHAYEYSQKRFKNGTPKDWPHRMERPGIWTKSEKDLVIEALEAFPEFLLTNRVEGFYRLRKSKDFPNPASHAEGVIAVYDSAFTNPNGLERILAHEFMHQIFNNLSEDEKRDYRRDTGWHYIVESDRQFYWAGRKDGYIADDGKNSHEEDFANNLEHYLYDPDTLKRVTPSAYGWIKKKYGDKLKLKDKKQ